MTTLHHVRPVSQPRNWLVALYQAWRRWRMRAATRKLLLNLNDQRLKDIGLTRGDIHQLYTSHHRDDTLRRR